MKRSSPSSWLNRAYVPRHAATRSGTSTTYEREQPPSLLFRRLFRTLRLEALLVRGRRPERRGRAWRVSPGRRLPALSSRLHASVCPHYLLRALVVDGRRRDPPRPDKPVVGDEPRREPDALATLDLGERPVKEERPYGPPRVGPVPADKRLHRAHRQAPFQGI